MALVVVVGLVVQSSEERNRAADAATDQDRFVSTGFDRARSRCAASRHPVDRPVECPAPSVVEHAQPAEGGGAVLEIVDAKHQITEDGRMIVTGEVTNSGDSRATNTKVRISLTDASGELVNSTEVFVTPERLSEGERRSVRGRLPRPGAERAHRLRVELDLLTPVRVSGQSADLPLTRRRRSGTLLAEAVQRSNRHDARIRRESTGGPGFPP